MPADPDQKQRADVVHNSLRKALGAAEKRAYRSVALIGIAQTLVGTTLYASDAGYPRGRLVAILAFSVLSLFLAAAELLMAPLWPRDSNVMRIMRHVVPLLGCVNFVALVGVTGGLGGPLLPLLFHVPVGQAGRYGRSSTTAVAFAATALGVIALTIAPAAWMGPVLAEPQRSICFVVMVVGVIASLDLEVAVVQAAYRDAAMRAEAMGEDLLRGHEERVRGLEAIGARVAHELKNPLTSMKSLLALQQDDAADETSKRRLDVVQREVDRMHRIIQDYLSFSRPLDRLRVERVDLLQLAHRVNDVLHGRAGKARVHIQVFGERLQLRADSHRLQGALLNFVGNALEATPAGGTVGIEVRRDGAEARIMVRDTGRGLSPQELKRLGTPFFTTKEGGTGLGVVVAKATIEQHGGGVSYESTQGQGTTLSIRLPLVAKVDEDEALSSYESLAHLDEAEKAALQVEIDKARRQSERGRR